MYGCRIDDRWITASRTSLQKLKFAFGIWFAMVSALGRKQCASSFRTALLMTAPTLGRGKIVLKAPECPDPVHSQTEVKNTSSFQLQLSPRVHCRKCRTHQTSHGAFVGVGVGSGRLSDCGLTWKVQARRNAVLKEKPALGSVNVYWRRFRHHIHIPLNKTTANISTVY